MDITKSEDYLTLTSDAYEIYTGKNEFFGTELEYIESTTDSSQFFNTDYKAGPNTRIVIKAANTSTSTSTSTYEQLIGANNGYHSSDGIQIAYNPGNEKISIDYGTSGVGPWSIEKNTPFIIDLKNGSVSVNDEETTFTNTFSGTCSYGLRIFDNNKKGYLEQHFNGRLYYLKIYEGSVLVKDYIPVLDTSKIPCLYDKISKTYLYKAKSTSDDFIARS